MKPLRPLRIEQRALLTHLLVLATAVFVGFAFRKFHRRPEELLTIIQVSAAFFFLASWLLSLTRWMRCGLCGTRYCQSLAEFVMPHGTCRSCGVTPGVRTTTPGIINSLLFNRFGLWGPPDEPVDEVMKYITVQDRRRRVPYLRRLRDDLDRSRLSRYDRERLIARIDRELNDVDGIGE